MKIFEELSHNGVNPQGPVSAWPRERHEALMKELHGRVEENKARQERGNDAKPGLGKMARNLVKTGGQALRFGRVEREVRNERYDTCKKCEKFDAESKRCQACGCFMEAKTWVGGNPNTLCPLQKWSR